ncbi:hypothetical protein FEF65_06640 [Mariprofundus erugo]|uniref:Uncharacterized protein n=1 Tax=Mariprofundus erugo TaxID=2528639 RepID=A0A5R9GTJ6_9PROT|nr:hypothetical protein [Mariprofundus erugo]TLS67587.1 hypothetical protein FEF65_06640 [Mariprofundus erugo]
MQWDQMKCQGRELAECCRHALPCWSIEQVTDGDRREFLARLDTCSFCKHYAPSTMDNLIAYRLDADDIIVYANKVWDAFAQNHNGANCCLSQIRGKSLWSQISDAETTMIYKKVFEKARSSYQAIAFRLRCDDLNEMRFLDVRVIPLPHHWLELNFTITEQRPREPQAIPQQYNEHNIITMCSFCGDLKGRDGNWHAIEDKITSADLFQYDPLPKISHGLCTECSTNFLKSIRTLKDKPLPGSVL